MPEQVGSNRGRVTRHKCKWTPAHDQRLLEIGNTMRAEEIAAEFHCSFRVVMRKRMILGIPKDSRKVIPPSVWTAQQIERVREMAKTMRAPEIGRVLKVTGDSIRNVCHKNGIRLKRGAPKGYRPSGYGAMIAKTTERRQRAIANAEHMIFLARRIATLRRRQMRAAA